MPKMQTPAMARTARRRKVDASGNKKTPSLWREAFRRLFRNRTAILGLVLLFILLLCALFPSVIAPYGYDDQDYSNSFRAPGRDYIMGTDSMGRDIFSRVVYGARISMGVGFSAVAVACVAGTVLGAASAFYGKAVDSIIMRMLDVLMSIPSLLLAIAIASISGGGLVNLVLAICISSIPTYARVVRASVLSLKEQEFVEAARAIGVNDLWIIFRHILPNALAPLIVQATLGLGTAILSCASLSFIGLGIEPPLPEWGTMLSSGRQYIREHWHVVVFPGVAIMIAVLSINLFGDGLRDALDPRLKR